MRSASGKTLSLAASAMISALLDDGPVLILCPSTLTLQWQVELKDQSRHPQRRLVVRPEGLDRPQRTHHQDPWRRGHHPVPVPHRHRLDRPHLP